MSGKGVLFACVLVSVSVVTGCMSRVERTIMQRQWEERRMLEWLDRRVDSLEEEIRALRIHHQPALFRDVQSEPFETMTNQARPPGVPPEMKD
jgi:hypothetical protein